jgi:hypothetical protein
MTKLDLKQIRDLAEYLSLTTSTVPGSTPVVNQLITSQKTFTTTGGTTDRYAAAGSTPGRFDSGSDVSSIALFGATTQATHTASAGFYGGAANPTGILSWVPFNTASNGDYGHFTLIQSRNAVGFDPSANGAVGTATAGVAAQYLYLSEETITGSPGTLFLEQGQTYYDPIAGRAKLYIRYGSPEWGYIESPNWEPALILHTHDQNSVVRAETVATFEKADQRYVKISSPTTQVSEHWFADLAGQSPYIASLMYTDEAVVITGAYVISGSTINTPSPAISLVLKTQEPSPAGTLAVISSPLPIVTTVNTISPWTKFDLNVDAVSVAADMLIQLHVSPASPGVELANTLVRVDYMRDL